MKNNKKFLIKDIALWANAKILKNEAKGFSHFLIDTRQYKTDSAFVPLRGGLDAYTFFKEAYDKGVRVFFIESAVEKKIFQEAMLLKGISLLQVSSTLKALQLIAEQWRKLLSGKVIAISGSNGKTSTKNFLYDILKEKKTTYKSPLSFNNHLGVPLSLLEADLLDEVIILEMGMSHKGELKTLVKMTRPDIVLITQVSQAHIGHLGSLQEVADAKMELYKFAPPTALKIFNDDNIFTNKMKKEHKTEVPFKQYFTFGLNSKNDGNHISATMIEESLSGLKFNLELFIKGVSVKKNLVFVPILGAHNLTNIGAAVAIGYNLGLEWESILSSLSSLKPYWGRMELLKEPNSGASVIFDAYNANPASFSSALNSLEKLSYNGLKIALVGGMEELGKYSDQEHYDLALRMGKFFDIIGFVGKQKSFGLALKKINFLGRFVQSEVLDSKKFKDLVKSVKLEVKKEDLIFIKASRIYQLEKLLIELGIKQEGWV